MIAEKLRQIQSVSTAPTNPAGISGLTVWLKADAGLIDGSGNAITANGTAIATWQNQATGGTHYNQATSGLRPTYRDGANGKNGLPVIDFNGASTQSLTHADLSAYSTGGITIFTICKWTSGQVWSANDGAGGVNYPISGYHPRYITGGDGIGNFATTNEDAAYTGWNFTKFASNVNVSYEFYPYGSPSTITTAGFASRGAAQTADCIGKHPNNADYFTGQIGEIIIYNRKLTDAECLTVRTYLLSRWGMASIDNVSLLLHMDGANNSTTFTDSGPNALAVTAVGDAKISTAQSKYGGASAYFDGNGDYLTIASASLFDFSADFTIEGWWNFTQINQYQGYSILFCGIELDRIQLTTVSGAIEVYMYGFLLSYTIASSSFVNTWTHFAVTRSGSTVKLWINGVNVASATRSTAIDVSGISIASQRNNGGYFGYFNGHVDDFRVKKGTCQYTTTFTPTGPFSNP